VSSRIKNNGVLDKLAPIRISESIAQISTPKTYYIINTPEGPVVTIPLKRYSHKSQYRFNQQNQYQGTYYIVDSKPRGQDYSSAGRVRLYAQEIEEFFEEDSSDEDN
jgi:hypothetical protein